MAHFPLAYDLERETSEQLSASFVTLSHQEQGTVEECSHAALSEHRIKQALSALTLCL